MIGEVWCTSVIYWLVSLIIVYPPDEAVSAGLTIEILLKSLLGSENISFVLYHVKRTSALLIAHSLLVPGYVITLSWAHPWIKGHLNDNYHPYSYTLLLLLSVTPVLIAGSFVIRWAQNNWRNHPFAKAISLYETENKSLNVLTREINMEYVRVDKFSSDLNSVSRIIATENWLIKVSPYIINFLSLRDAVIVILSSDDVSIIRDSNSPIQYISVHVKSLNEHIKSFNFRLNSIMWREFEQKSVNPVVNTKNILIHQSLADRFFPVFDETVQQNPKILSQEDQDFCIGCMASKANVLLKRRCKEVNANSECTACSCRPMWCLPCLSKWFAARQDHTKPDTWLSSRAPCPTCRSAFCMLDVHIIESM